MYRNQYPDAPNLFSNLRRPFRPTLVQEFRNTWLTSLIGIALLALGLGTIIWNEGRTVRIAQSLEEGHRNVLVPETIDVVFDENNGKLVLISGQLNVEDKLEDIPYGISIQAVKLKKRVQMYQWFETEDQKHTSGVQHEGDHDQHVETSYSYDRDWFDRPIDSNAFNSPMGHHNSESWIQNASLQVNNRVKIGGFLLGHDLKEKFDDFTIFTSDERPANPQIKMHAGLYYHANNVWEPEVGDVRIQFSYAGHNGELVTVIGRQSGREIRPYRTAAGEDLLLLHYGYRKPDDIFRYEHSQNRIQTWLYRLFGWFVAFLGLNCLESILDILVDDSPAVRNILALGITSIPFSFSMSLSLLCIGFGWIFYRPIIGGILLTLALIPFVWATYRIHQRRAFEARHRL